jgi:hypothetical protein
MGDEIKEDGMGGALDTMGEKRNVYRFWWGKLERKSQTGRRLLRWDNRC